MRALTLFDGHTNSDAQIVDERKQGRIILVGLISSCEIVVYTHDASFLIGGR